MIWFVSSLLSISRPTSKYKRREKRKRGKNSFGNSKARHPILLVAGGEVLWNEKSGKGMAKLRGARRGVWGFEEVPSVVVDGLVAEFVKEERHLILLVANSDWESLVTNCWLRRKSVRREIPEGKTLPLPYHCGKKVMAVDVG